MTDNSNWAGLKEDWLFFWKVMNNNRENSDNCEIGRRAKCRQFLFFCYIRRFGADVCFSLAKHPLSNDVNRLLNCYCWCTNCVATRDRIEGTRHFWRSIEAPKMNVFPPKSLRESATSHNVVPMCLFSNHRLRLVDFGRTRDLASDLVSNGSLLCFDKSISNISSISSSISLASGHQCQIGVIGLFGCLDILIKFS